MVRGGHRVVLVAATLVALGAQLGCGSQSHQPTTSKDAVIRIDCAVADAQVSINDRELGSIDQLRRGVALSPGRHRLEVRHQGYHTHYAELELARRERRVIVVELAERFP